MLGVCSKFQFFHLSTLSRHRNPKANTASESISSILGKAGLNPRFAGEDTSTRTATHKFGDEFDGDEAVDSYHLTPVATGPETVSQSNNWGVTTE